MLDPIHSRCASSGLAARFWCIEKGAPRGRKHGARSSVAQNHLFGPGCQTEPLRGDLLAVDWYLAWRFDADANLIAIDLHHGDTDVFADDDFLTQKRW